MTCARMTSQPYALARQQSVASGVPTNYGRCPIAVGYHRVGWGEGAGLLPAVTGLDLDRWSIF